jgi:hypothetical protein
LTEVIEKGPFALNAGEVLSLPARMPSVARALFEVDSQGTEERDVSLAGSVNPISSVICDLSEGVSSSVGSAPHDFSTFVIDCWRHLTVGSVTSQFVGFLKGNHDETIVHRLSILHGV